MLAQWGQRHGEALRYNKKYLAASKSLINTSHTLWLVEKVFENA